MSIRYALRTDVTPTQYPVYTRWKSLAACKNETVNIFFPSPSDAGSISNKASMICRTCVVRLVCLEYALTNHIVHGIWGGASARQRQRIARDRRLNTLLDKGHAIMGPSTDGEHLAVAATEATC